MVRTLAVARALVAALMLLAVGRLAWQGIADGSFVPWNFFGYFTIQNNLIGVAALAIAARYVGRERPEWVELLRLTAAVTLTIVVTVYWTLLLPTDDEPWAWTNLVVHGLSGVALVADWLVDGPRRPLPWGLLPWVMAYPLLWVAVTLVRGATDGWFPYPFLDPANGYAAIAMVVGGIVVAGLALGALYMRATRWRALVPA
ncbi:Pr6Pr family membrane protein [Demequina sp. SYSU T00039]|uniref:Pr6Pr family membrane protein n=1 Tax=Demequina lignilytica TaxID=3051663 RepID=A0AAW7M3W8_9MICO|nr:MULTISPECIES: Pr6Pr family membrane protein [unclassified Demequina]MDN4478626.1 Pr6Pr family membrane protein [Demequina sp. SYSU T00039-1]MDN4488604.1 Pr6Pr family membrane protein [Demequina sp. SYSU T00039]